MFLDTALHTYAPVATTETGKPHDQFATMQRALAFGPGDEAWHFMPAHLRLGQLLATAASLESEANRYLIAMPGWLEAAQLDIDIWRETHVAKLPAGVVLARHQHPHAGAIYLLAGAVRIATAAGVQIVEAASGFGFAPSSSHEIELLAPSVLIETFSPRLRGHACHEFYRHRDTTTAYGPTWLDRTPEEVAGKARISAIQQKAPQAMAANGIDLPAPH